MDTKAFLLACTALLIVACGPQRAQAPTDSDTPLHLVQPDYPVPYGELTEGEVKGQLDRALAYLQEATPMAVLDGAGNPITDFATIDSTARLQRGDFRLTSYEWGVCYSAMLATGAVTGDTAYTRYATERLRLLAQLAPHFERVMEETGTMADDQMRQVVQPRKLDDCGAMCTAMIKASKAGVAGLDSCIERYIRHVRHGEYRLADGTFARKRPQHNSVWLDDMFMGLPPLAHYATISQDEGPALQMEAARLALAFKERLWVPERRLFRHGWVEAMEPHPDFFWARANGWALLTLCELLDVLPEDHPLRAELLALLQDHAQGLAALQSGEGRWHQLLDRNDTYLETSASAIFVYALAHAINQGWLDATAYGPVAQLGWQAVAAQINERGQVEGTCVGTGMAFDVAYYCHRPVTPYAAHGYGPVIWAGGEMIALLRNLHPRMNNNTLQYYTHEQNSPNGTFEVEP